MYISLNKIKQYIDIPENITPYDIGEKLTLHTVEIDEMIDKEKEFQNMVIGRIEKIEKHPNADKLSVCQVSIEKNKGIFKKGSDNNIQIVCGGNNLEKGMYVAVALPGALVKWHGEGDFQEIKESKIRDIKSFGMICSSKEIGLFDIFPEEEGQILNLNNIKKQNSNLKINGGEKLSEALELNDFIYDIDNKSITNRPDLWSHYGIAREISAIFNLKIKQLILKPFKTLDYTQLKTNIENDDLCQNYTAVVIENIELKESPYWLKKELYLLNQKPINNIVDLANYVMYETGQPLHTFDAGKVSNKIYIREAKESEKIITLDDKEEKLDNSMLIIADSIKPIAIAGIIGGKDSGVSSYTKSIILESANFDGISIRKTSSKLNTRTEASARFEKQQDPNLCNIGFIRYINLLSEISDSNIKIQEIKNIKNFEENETGIIRIDKDFINKKIGKDFTDKEIKNILTKLKFEVSENKNEYIITIPTFRLEDIKIKEDVVEEIARIYGYNNIKQTPLYSEINPIINNNLRRLEKKIKNILIGCGYNESFSYSFLSKKDLDLFEIKEEDLIKVKNPLSKDAEYLRDNITIGQIKNLLKNIKNEKEIKLFEISRVFDSKLKNKYKNLPYQNYHLSCLNFIEKGENNIYKIKNILEKIFDTEKIRFYYQNTKNVPNYLHPERSIDIMIGQNKIGFLSEIHPKILSKLKIKDRVGVFEIDFEFFEEFSKRKNIEYKEFSKIQESNMDISVVVKEKINWQEIRECVQKTSKNITKIKVFDVFKNEKIGEDKKSISFNMTFGNFNKTPKSEDIEKIWKDVLENLKREFDAKLR
ncbi:phenylalanine--tRNA ligase subunit beta [Patescibacteria group bacterium]|nr:phenylalanine--tRNA ligase subunit beta [Patescibacteria group bacterium]